MEKDIGVLVGMYHLFRFIYTRDQFLGPREACSSHQKALFVTKNFLLQDKRNRDKQLTRLLPSSMFSYGTGKRIEKTMMFFDPLLCSSYTTSPQHHRGCV